MYIFMYTYIIIYIQYIYSMVKPYISVVLDNKL